VPNEIDEQVADLKLASLGLSIDTLSKEQKRYSCSWDIGT
jgi:adenosylhomocysteinase